MSFTVNIAHGYVHVHLCVGWVHLDLEVNQYFNTSLRREPYSGKVYIPKGYQVTHVGGIICMHIQTWSALLYRYNTCIIL